MMQISKNHIQNIDNYRESFQDSTATIFIKYMNLISEYLKHSKDFIFIQNPTYYNYVLKKGISTITHVFKFLLIYTKNLEMVYFNCQKSYIYYVEFIGQIGDDNHSFLQLNSKDAALFVYKKTIFEINNDIRKDYVCDNNSEKKITEIDNLIKIYSNILFYLMDNNSLINIIKIVNTDLLNIMNKILKIYVDSENHKYSNNIQNKIESIVLFSTYYKKDNLLEHLELFIRKIKKLNNTNNYKLKQILINQDSPSNISNVKYINYITSHISI